MPAGDRKVSSVDLGNKLDQRLVTNQHRDLFIRFVEQMNSGVYVTDENGQINFWNHKLELLVGILATEALGENVCDIHLRLLPERTRTDQLQAQITHVFQTLLTVGHSTELFPLA